MRIDDAVTSLNRDDVVRCRLHTLMDLLSDRVRRDVELFATEFPERAISYEEDIATGGFIVRRGHEPAAHLTVTPVAYTGSVLVDYVFTSSTSTVAPKPLTLVFDGDGIRGWHVARDPGRPVRSLAEFSEYLLTPIFTGEPYPDPAREAVALAAA